MNHQMSNRQKFKFKHDGNTGVYLKGGRRQKSTPVTVILPAVL